MKTFKDIKFKTHAMGSGYMSQTFFENGYGISVVQLDYLGPEEYEIAVLKGNKKHWVLTYKTPITDDVIGHLGKDEVTHYMKLIQELPATRNV